MSRQMPPQEFGPDIDFRESSFMSNPRMTPAVRDNKLTVRLCEPSSGGGCSDGSSPAPVSGDSIQIQKGLNPEQLVQALHHGSGYKVLEFESMEGAFGQFSDKQQEQRFYRRMAQYASLWCCVQGAPGHIWYDLLFDIPGHRDRHNRIWDTWQPKLGP